MKTLHKTALSAALLMAGQPVAARDFDAKPDTGSRSELHVQLGLGTSSKLWPGTSEEFQATYQKHCHSGVVTTSAGGALLAIGVDWLVGRLIGAFKNNLKATLAEYSADYAPETPLADPFNPSRWSSDTYPNSCLIVQRVSCSVAVGERCPKSARAVQSQLVLLENHHTHLLALPVAIEVDQLATRHRGGSATLASGIRLEGLSYLPEAGGVRWSSGDAILFSESFDATRDAKDAPAVATFKRVVPDPDWATAVVIPMPPRMPASADRDRIGPASPVTLHVAIAEVGQAPKMTKALLAFLDDKGDDVGDVFSAAAKKKLGLD